MNEAVYIIAAVLFLGAGVFFAHAMKKTSSPKRKVRLTGIIGLTGTELFPELVFTNEAGSWFIAEDSRVALKDLMHKKVTVEAYETIEQLTVAGGFPAGKRYELSDVRIYNGYGFTDLH